MNSSPPTSGHVTPTSYTGSQYTLFKKGTKSNSTHWQFTALCRGCTAWNATADDPSSAHYLSPRGGNRLAFAYSATKPSNANSPSSATLTVHDVFNYWSHDFAQAANANFDATVAKLTS